MLGRSKHRSRRPNIPDVHPRHRQRAESGAEQCHFIWHTTQYGGDLEGRSRFLVQVVDAVREVWPEDRPLFARLFATH